MFPIATKQGGTAVAFPDVCKTPTPAGPVPIPYPNTGQMMQANPGTCPKKVKILNQPPLTTQSIIVMSSGDEAGTVGGVVSGMVKGPVQFKKGSAGLIRKMNLVAPRRNTISLTLKPARP